MSAENRRFPAEWEKQQGILLCFPHDGKDWPGKYRAIQWALVDFIKKIAATEQLILLVADETLLLRVSEMLTRSHVNISNIHFVIHRTNRSWMRDSGPIIVKNGAESREALDFHFNGWAKYKNFHLDRTVPRKIASFLNIPLTKAVYRGKPVVLEGGAIDSNGKGTLITSGECLLDPEVQVRNPGFTKADYEAVFAEYLGISNTIWIGEGIRGDDTHGHIDDLCRFVNENTIISVVEPDHRDENYRPLQDNLSRLKKATLEDGKSPNVVELPMPEKLVFEGIRIPASYANFLILNNSVLVPTFNDPNDRIALNILAACFPGREVTGIGALDLIWGFGTLHCLSQQVPE